MIDFANTIFFDDGQVIACLASNPWKPGHTIVCLNDASVKNLWELSLDDATHFWKIVSGAQKILREVYEAFNVPIMYWNIKQMSVHAHLIPLQSTTDDNLIEFTKEFVVTAVAREITEDDLIEIPALKRGMEHLIQGD
mgnify:CR=1 FL=1